MRRVNQYDIPVFDTNTYRELGYEIRTVEDTETLPMDIYLKGFSRVEAYGADVAEAAWEVEKDFPAPRYLIADDDVFARDGYIEDRGNYYPADEYREMEEESLW